MTKTSWSKIRSAAVALPLTAAMFVGVTAAADAANAAPATAPAATPAAAQAAVQGTSTPVTGTNGSTAFDGTFTVSKFEEQNGQPVAVGTVTGTATDKATGATQQVSQAVTTPVTNASTPAGCNVLNLLLGPLHLNVLGLVVDLNQVVLNITAVGGVGALLGNLLCGVGNLLDVLGLGQLLSLLNSLLG
jgi:hypothetical protein